MHEIGSWPYLSRSTNTYERHKPSKNPTFIVVLVWPPSCNLNRPVPLYSLVSRFEGMETDQMAEKRWVPQYPPMSQPHFVEERTLLSARPVVPLEQLRTTERSRRGLLLMGAVAFSLVLGACTALAIVYVQQPRSGQPGAVSSQPNATQPNAAEQITPPPTGPGEESAVVERGSASADAGALREASNTKPEQEKKAAVVNASNSENKRVATVSSARISQQNEVPVAVADAGETDARLNDREERRDERREERRVRREEIRQRRVNSGDDLFRIREIFEGRRRPE